MPIVRVDVSGPKTTSYKAAVLDGVRAGVTSGLAVPDARVTVRLVEIAPGESSLPSCRTERFTVVEIALYEGRTPELKNACVQAIRDNLADLPGIEPSEVAVLFNDKRVEDLNLPPGEADA